MTRDDARLDARAALNRAEQLERVVRQRHAAWYVRYLLLAALAALGTLTAAGVLTSAVQQTAYGLGWCLCYGALSCYWVYQMQHQPVLRHGFQRVHSTFVAVYAALYVLVGAVGGLWFPHTLAWWAPGALVVAAPCAVAAYLVVR